jgi:hypothetical protein
MGAEATRRGGGARARRVALGVTVALAPLVVIAAAVLGPSSEARPQVPFGFSNNAVLERVATPEAAASAISAAGGEVDRVQVDWASLEPTPGARSFEPYDAIYEADVRHGVRPLFILAFAPQWATDVACAQGPNPCHAAPAPEHFVDMARTAAALAARYPHAAGIEIWNEPNAPYFWAPTPDPRAYSKLLKKCSRAIDRVAPRMPVAGGSTSSSPGFVPGHIAAPEFVRGMKRSRALKHIDALSLHAYPDQADVTGESAVAHVESVRAALGRRRKPIWITETGVTTTGPQAVSEETQALSLLRLSERLPEVARVKMVLMHTLVEPPRGTDDRETGFGIVRRATLPVVQPDLLPKPAYCALREAWGGEQGCGLPS